MNCDTSVCNLDSNSTHDSRSVQPLREADEIRHLPKLRPLLRCFLSHSFITILLTFQILAVLVMRLTVKSFKKSGLQTVGGLMCRRLDGVTEHVFLFLEVCTGCRLRGRYNNARYKLRAFAQAVLAVWNFTHSVVNDWAVVGVDEQLAHQTRQTRELSMSMPTQSSTSVQEALSDPSIGKLPGKSLLAVSSQWLDYLLDEFRASQLLSTRSRSKLGRPVRDNQLIRRELYNRRSSPPSETKNELLQHAGSVSFTRGEGFQGSVDVQCNGFGRLSDRSSRAAMRHSASDTSVPLHSSSSNHVKSKSVQMNEKRPTVQIQRCSVYERRYRDSASSPTQDESIHDFKSFIPVVERRSATKKTLEGPGLKQLRLQRMAR